MEFDNSNEEFSEKICDLISQGYGLTPFLGSGCSASSGIMMGQEFTDYLGHAIRICVEGTSGDGDTTASRWDIARNGWPERPSEEEIVEARAWVRRKFDVLIKEYGMRALFDDDHRVIDYRLDSHVSSPELLAKLLNAPVVPPFLRSHDLKTEDSAIRAIQEVMWGKQRANERIIFSTSKSETSYAAICEKAIRSLSDWRATLHFLAMLRHVKTVKGVRLSIGELDPSIIDRFNVHITKNKKPNLTHQMIAQLSMSARIRVILTTNFDKLIESAFESFGRPISSIPVGTHGGLPHPDLVHANDCLVKLHGDCHETRADYTLDDPPTPGDKNRFFHYVRGDYPDFTDSNPGSRRFIPSQLLIVGYSGSDRRCNDMIKYVLDSDEDAKVFWVCHSKRDLDRLGSTFGEDDYKKGRIIATRTERPDLLLYDIYQKLNLTLPSPGSTYHFPDRVMPAKSPLPKDANQAIVEQDAAEIEKQLTGKHENGEGSIVILKGGSGVLNVVHQALEQLGMKGRNRIWLELEDFPDAPSVGAEIRTGLSLRTGSLPLGHVKPLPFEIIERMKEQDAGKKDISEKEEETLTCAWEVFFADSCKELGVTAGMWTVGLYGRNGPGGCAGWQATHETWGEEHYKELQLLIRGLSKAGFNILYAPYTDERSDRDVERLRDLEKLRVHPSEAVVQEEKGPTGNRDNLPQPPWNPITTDSTSLVKDKPGPKSNVFVYKCRYKQSKQLNFKHVMEDVSAHILDLGSVNEVAQCLGHKVKERMRWLTGVRALHSATLFRQSRHFSAFMTDAIYRCPNQFNLTREDNDEKRVNDLLRWIGKLLDFGVFYTKPGGFAWAYRDIRLGIRSIIDSLHFDPIIVRQGQYVRMKNFTPGNHFFIGEWYAKAHLVTRHPVPMLEGAHHFFQSILFVPHFGSPYAGKIDREEEKEAEWFSNARKGIFFSSIIALLNLLRSGESSLRYWGSVPFRRSMFKKSVAEGVIRQIKEVMIFTFTKEIEEKLARNAQTFPPEKSAYVECVANLYLNEKNQEGIDHYAWTLIHDLGQDFKYIERRISADYRITDIPFQKNIPAKGPYSYEFDGTTVKPDGTPVNFADVEELTSEMLKAYSIPDSLQYERKFPGFDWFCCKSGIFNIFQTIYKEKDDAAPKSPGKSDSLSKKLRGQKRQIEIDFLLGTHGCIANPHEINLFIQSLIEWAFVFVRRAKKLLRSREKIPVAAGNPDAGTEDYQKDFLGVTVLCNIALNLSRMLPPAYSECAAKEQIKAQSLYALALGHLGRFREAHRRLGEARVLCRSIGNNDSSVLLGIAELRRAEVLCLEARECGAVLRWLRETGPDGDEDKAKAKEKDAKSFAETFKPFVEKHDFDKLAATPPPKEAPSFIECERAKSILKQRVKGAKRGSSAISQLAEDLNRVSQAKIGDAWRCLEESRRRFSGRTHSSRWWGRQYALELRVFGEAELAIQEAHASSPSLEWFRMLPCRSRRDLAGHLRKIWQNGIAVAGNGQGDEQYSRLKTTSVYLFALNLAPPSLTARMDLVENRHGDLRLTSGEAKKACKEIIEFLKKEFPGKDGGTDEFGLAHYLKKESDEIEAMKRQFTGEKLKKKLTAIGSKRGDITIRDLFENENKDLNRTYYMQIVRTALLLDYKLNN